MENFELTEASSCLFVLLDTPRRWTLINHIQVFVSSFLPQDSSLPQDGTQDDHRLPSMCQGRFL